MIVTDEMNVLDHLTVGKKQQPVLYAISSWWWDSSVILSAEAFGEHDLPLGRAIRGRRQRITGIYLSLLLVDFNFCFSVEKRDEGMMRWKRYFGLSVSIINYFYLCFEEVGWFMNTAACLPACPSFFSCWSLKRSNYLIMIEDKCQSIL